MKNKFILASLLVGAFLALIFYAVKPNNSEQPVPEIKENSKKEEVIPLEQGELPQRLNLEFPDKIKDPNNPCYSLEVQNEVQEKRQEFSETTEEIKKENARILEEHELPFEIFRGDENIKSVSLTIDTGVGGSEGIEEILRLAEHYDIRLSFFITGCWALQNPSLVQQIVKEGHSIGNHSLTHLNLSGASETQIRREIGETDRILEEITGFRPVLFRKPQYAGGDRITGFAAEYKKISIQGYPDLGDTTGWRLETTPENVFNRVKNNTQPGAIWVLHNLSLADIKAFEDIIRFHLEEGYELVKVEEMLL